MVWWEIWWWYFSLSKSTVKVQYDLHWTKTNTTISKAWISHDWEYRYTSVGNRYLKKKGGVDQKTSQILVTRCSETYLICIESIRLLIVACGMLSHSSSMAVRSCWILAGTGTRCCTRRSRASQTCSMGDMSSEYAGHGRTGPFSASRNFVQILLTWGHALSCWNKGWWQQMNATTMGLRILSRHLCAFKLPSIKWNCVRCL